MKLQIGDRVECEVQNNGRPRWSGSIDYGGNGLWVAGRVVEVHSAHIVVRLPEDTWHVPMPGHTDYAYDQWERQGFLRRAA